MIAVEPFFLKCEVCGRGFTSAEGIEIYDHDGAPHFFCGVTCALKAVNAEAMAQIDEREGEK